MVEKNYTLKKTIIILAPYNQHYSPYLAMSNNPISFVDPTGGEDILYYTNDLYNWFANFYNDPDFWNTSLSPQFENYDSYQEYLTALKRFGEPERILLAGGAYQTIFVKQKQSNAKFNGEPNWVPRKYYRSNYLMEITPEYMSSIEDRKLPDLYAQKDGDGQTIFEKYNSFKIGYDAGFISGMKSTGNFFLSLGTTQGWKDFGMGMYNMGMISCNVCPNGIDLRNQIDNAIISYWYNIPNMSSYQIGFDAGLGVEKIFEIVLTKRAMPILKSSLGLPNGFGTVSSYTNRYSLSLKSTFNNTRYKIYTPILGIKRYTYSPGIGISRNISTPVGYAIGFGLGQHLPKNK